MSGIFGIVRFDGTPVEAEQLARMATAMKPWGRNAITTEVDRSAGFGQALTHATPEDVHTTMPWRWMERDVMVTAAGRLDNRGDIERQLGISDADAAAMADTEVMINAYQKWGEDCAAHLFGDWCLASWDEGARRLFLARDHHGNTALTVHRDPRTGAIAFANDARALHAIGAPRRLNELYLAQVLVSWPAYHGPQTIDLDITRIPPAHSAIADERGMRLQQFWDPMGNVELRLGSLDDYAEGLLAVYDEAVRARCRSVGPLAVTLSGGLDSGSVAALAQRELTGRDQSLLAFTHVPLADTSGSVGAARFGDETLMSSRTAEYLGIREHQLRDSRAVSPVQGIEDSLHTLDAPAHAASNAFWIHDLLTAAVDSGASTMLTGQGGNATISWTGMRPGHTFRSRLRTKGVRGGLGYLQPLWMQRRRELYRLREQRWSGSAIEPGFADRVHLSELAAAAIGVDHSRFAQRQTARDQRGSITRPGTSRVGDLWAVQSAFAGIDVRDPTTDARVIDFTFAVPDDVFISRSGLDRMVIRTAMAGLMPDEVRLNPDRGRQSADLVARLRTCAPDVDAALAEIESGSGGQYVSLLRMRDAWWAAQSSDDATTTHRAGSVLLRGMMAGLWLTRTYG
jgi:asparagine synthase (glutamine-hydrolysing)